MKTQHSGALGITAALLVCVVVADVLCLTLVLNRIDYIINTELYDFGLVYNAEFASNYSNQLNLLINSLRAIIVLISLSLAFLSLHLKRGGGGSKFASILFLIVGTATQIYFVSLFNNFDFFINNDLYRYGLQFSYQWADSYWSSARTLLTLVGFGIAAAFTSATVIIFSGRKTLKPKAPNPAYSFLIAIGALALLVSMLFVSSILAFIGLGLLFLGGVFTLIRSDDYVQRILLDVSASSQQATLRHILQELEFKGDIIYLPPKYFRNFGTQKAYISEKKGVPLPKPEIIQSYGHRFLIENPSGVLFTPPGDELAKLFEKILGVDFGKVDLQYLQQNLPSLFVEKLEIAQKFTFEVRNSNIHVRVEDSAYRAFGMESEYSPSHYSNLGSFLGSGLACVLAKTMGKPIVIEEEKNSQDFADVNITYRTLEEET